jgi:hypothetical protein
MKFAIETRYQGPTDTKGSRIVAKLKGPKHWHDERQRQLTMPYKHELNSEDNHYLAMALLVAKWDDPNWAEGCIAESTYDGYLFMQGWQTRHTHYRLQVKGFIPMEVAA